MSRERIKADLIGWDAIDDHRTGTAGDAETSGWLAAEISAAGAAPEIDRFPFVRRVPGLCQVSDGEHRADGLPLFDGGTTPDEGVTGRAGPLGSDAPIGVGVFGPNAAAPGNRELDSARRGGKHAAIVAISEAEGILPGLAVRNAESWTDPFGPPVLQVGTGAKAWLESAAALGSDLAIHAELTEEATQADNVQCRVEGRQPALPPLLVMTPKSAWWTCTAERGGGISLWLNMVRHFAANGADRTVIFTANTGHELGHVGLDHFLARHPDLIAGSHAWIHLGANFAAREAPVLYQAATEALMTEGLAALNDHGITDINITPVGQRPYGEARNVHDGGGNYISLIGQNRWFHHPDDRWPVSIDLDKLVKINEAFLTLAMRLAGA